MRMQHLIVGTESHQLCNAKIADLQYTEPLKNHLKLAVLFTNFMNVSQLNHFIS